MVFSRNRFENIPFLRGCFILKGRGSDSLTFLYKGVAENCEK